MPKLEAAGHAYFVTWRLLQPGDELADAERDLIARSLEHFHGLRYRLLCYVVMNDHVHVIALPLGEWSLSEILHSWKSYTANLINRARGVTGSRWQKDSFTRAIRDEEEFRQKAQYILNNPLKRWPGIREYRWVKVFPFEW